MFVFVAASVGVHLFAFYLATRFDAAPDLQYAFVVFQLPYGIFVVSIVTALVPDLSERFAHDDTEGYRATLSFGLRALYVVPATSLSAIFGIRGVALAFTVSYAVAALLLLWAMRREISRIDGRQLAEALLRIGLAEAAMYGVATVDTSLLGEGRDTLSYALVLAQVGAASLAVYLLTAPLLRVEELRSAITLLRRRSPSEARARE